jgi:hypothetical protein
LVDDTAVFLLVFLGGVRFGIVNEACRRLANFRHAGVIGLSSNSKASDFFSGVRVSGVRSRVMKSVFDFRGVLAFLGEWYITGLSQLFGIHDGDSSSCTIESLRRLRGVGDARIGLFLQPPDDLAQGCENSIKWDDEAHL